MSKEKVANRAKVVGMVEFIKANVGSKTIAEVAEKTGLKPASIQQRRAAYRKRGIALPEFARGGGGNTLDVDSGKALLAELLKAKKA